MPEIFLPGSVSASGPDTTIGLFGTIHGQLSQQILKERVMIRYWLAAALVAGITAVALLNIPNQGVANSTPMPSKASMAQEKSPADCPACTARQAPSCCPLSGK